MPGGRPTTYNDETAIAICARLVKGESLTSICESEEMPDVATVYRWRLAHHEFREMYARAREDQADTLFEMVDDIAAEEPPRDMEGRTDSGWVAHRRLRVDVIKWRAGKLRPKVYGDKVTQEHTGVDGGPIRVITGLPEAKPGGP